MPIFIPNLVSTKHGHKFVELSEFFLELWETWTWVLKEGLHAVVIQKEPVLIVNVFKLAVCLFLDFWIALKMD